MEHNNKIQIEGNLDHSYRELPSFFFTAIPPDSVPRPELIIFNDKLAQELGLDSVLLKSKDGIDILVGNQIPEDAFPLAMAYGGHQFGHFAKLGDGRAILLGECITPDHKRIDIQLKGSGRTPYSRGGDGKATIGPMLREYIISEAMYALGIPTTRSLAVIKTGEDIMRVTPQSGAILTRTASSHLRVGTFEFAAKWGTIDDLKSLADYSINRHFPNSMQTINPYLSLLEKVIEAQAKLIAKWNLVGFIHGVMNTDNVTISGETIDYGPCAFMDDYSISTVFSSIDHHGRYAYGNQASITQWNMTRFAETLLALIHNNLEESTKEAKLLLSKFPKIYHQEWLSGMCYKIGIFEAKEDDNLLINRLLELMEYYKGDYTNTFKALTTKNLGGITLFETDDFKQWYSTWIQRLKEQPQTDKEIEILMKATNPAVIPRNHLVEKALTDATLYGNLTTMHKLLDALKEPFSYTTVQEEYSQLPATPDEGYRTYCGT